jgi:hypothetical protein
MLNTQDKIYLSEMFDQKFEEKFELKFDQKFDQKFSQSFEQSFKSVREQLNEDFQRHTGILKEDFQHKMDTVIEMLKDKPGRGEFNELKDEVSDMHRGMNVFQLNLKDHERRIVKLEIARR